MCKERQGGQWGCVSQGAGEAATPGLRVPVCVRQHGWTSEGSLSEASGGANGQVGMTAPSCGRRSPQVAEHRKRFRHKCFTASERCPGRSQFCILHVSCLCWRWRGRGDGRDGRGEAPPERRGTARGAFPTL